MLDDVWNEDSSIWDGLKTHLKLGAKGKQKSWDLFERVAIKEMNFESTNQHLHLLEIGKDIVDKCNRSSSSSHKDNRGTITTKGTFLAKQY